MTSFGERLRSSREGAKLNQRELAKRTKLHYNTIGFYEKDKNEPSFSKIQLLAEALNVDFVWLATGETLVEYILRRHGQFDKNDQAEKRRATDHIAHMNHILAGLLKMGDEDREFLKEFIALYVSRGKEK